MNKQNPNFQAKLRDAHVAIKNNIHYINYTVAILFCLIATILVIVFSINMNATIPGSVIVILWLLSISIITPTIIYGQYDLMTLSLTISSIFISVILTFASISKMFDAIL
jgi:hypothetical protein